MSQDDPDWDTVEALFDEAQDVPEAEREDFVRARAESDAVADEVLSLLTAARDSTQFLETSDGAGPAKRGPLLEPGTRLGAWRIDSLIDRGGMGDVYHVSRADGQYDQRAALKLMNAASEDYRQLFEHERQYLARLEHPGIARLLDGGVADDGRPWMVMELATGAPIDIWVREQQPDVRRIVQLVIQAGEALAHAHRQLIVHRDVKPANILVDETGRTRVIDFGIARPGDEETSEATPLSLDFAAPEIIEGKAAGTASDIYGLAATLYALLTGEPPLELSRDPLPLAARRAIEEDPQPLSSAMTGKPGRALVRDLEAVLARALSKTPDERYATLDTFCDDLRHAVSGKPVAARRSERGYVAQRLLKRHAWQTTAVAALALSLVAGLSASLWQARQANLERDWALREQARLEAVQQYLFFMLRDGADATGGTEASADEILNAAAEQVTDMFATDPEQGGPVMHTLGELYFYLNDYEAAEPMLERLVDSEDIDPALMARARYDLAQVRLRAGDPQSAAPLLDAAQSFWKTAPDRWHRRLVDSRLVEARLLRDKGRITEAVALLEENLPERIELSGETDRKTGVYYNDLGVMLSAAGRFEDAREPLRTARGIWRDIGLDNSPDALNTLNNLATIEVLTGRHAEAAEIFGEVLDLRRTLYGDSAATAAVLNNYGKTLLRLDDAGGALPLLEEGAAMAREHAGEASMTYASAVAGLSRALSETGQETAALDTARQGHTRVTEAAGPSTPMAAITATALARETARDGETARAAELLDQAEAIFKPMGPGAERQLQKIAGIRNQFSLEAAVPRADRTSPGTARREP